MRIIKNKISTPNQSGSGLTKTTSGAFVQQGSNGNKRLMQECEGESTDFKCTEYDW